MSKIVNKLVAHALRAFVMPASVPDHFEKFDLVVIEPVKGKPGKLVFTLSIHAVNVTDAVKTARQMVDGTGFVVLQRSAYALMNDNNPAILNALADAYERKFG